MKQRNATAIKLAVEVYAGLGTGLHGGLQWYEDLPKPNLGICIPKESLQKNRRVITSDSPIYVLEKKMDEIQSSLEAFQNLLHYTYYFTIAYKKELHNIKLTFYEKTLGIALGCNISKISIFRNILIGYSKQLRVIKLRMIFCPKAGSIKI